MNAAVLLLQGKEKPGTKHVQIYTRPIWLDKTNASGSNCFALPQTAAGVAGAARALSRQEIAPSLEQESIGLPPGRRERADVDRQHGQTASGWRLRASLSPRLLLSELLAEAMVRAGDPLHRDDRPAGVVSRRRFRTMPGWRTCCR